MSCLGLNQIKLSNKVWKNFTSKISSKVRKIRRSKTLRSILGQKDRPPVNHHRLFNRAKLRTRGSSKPVYVDDLFSTSSEAQIKHLVIPPREAHNKVFDEIPTKKEVKFGAVGCSSTTTRMIGGLEGVDLQAELFIAKFREEMRLQREISFREYQEMLARGT